MAGIADLLGLAEHARSGPPVLSVGVLTADLARLDQEINTVSGAGVRLVHLDVMDGHFCPMFTFGAPLVAALPSSILKDVHLMIEDPLRHVDSFVEAGADIVTFHVEATRQPLRILQVLDGRENANDSTRGIFRGVAVAPSTNVQAVEPLVDYIEYLLLLAINPGWPNQRFLDSTRHRVDEAHDMIARSGRRIFLGIDGGVNQANAEWVFGLGADIVVSGSAIFDGQHAAENARHMLALARSARPHT